MAEALKGTASQEIKWLSWINRGWQSAGIICVYHVGQKGISDICYFFQWTVDIILTRIRAHYSDVIMSAIASQITGVSMACSTVGRSNEISKLCITGLCEGNSPVTGEFPSQRASYAENVSIWWRHHEMNRQPGNKMAFLDKHGRAQCWNTLCLTCNTKRHIGYGLFLCSEQFIKYELE